ncbi:MAG: single-stranded DNA-binding protein [Bacteroidota bacterium]|nr:single-stranded DNA-binding protein [Bacteroidota bacterium]
MALGINKVILIGNLGKDPITQDIGNGIKKATFSLATTETLTSREGTKTEHTEWHNIILWRGLAEVAEKYLRKGNQVYIEGRLRSRQYDDKEGVKHYVTEIQCDNMVMMGGGKQSGPAPVVTGQQEQYGAPAESQNNNNQGGNVAFGNDVPNDDLPF